MGERRRFPPPWSVTDNGSAWIVADATGFKVSWHYYGGETLAAERMTREEAYAQAVNHARLPELLTTLKRG